MRIYLTSAINNKEQCLWLRGWLERQGHRVTSSWFSAAVGDVPAELQPAMAMIEISESDAVLEYAASDAKVSATASFEGGYAYCSGKKLFYIGEPSTMFMARYGQQWPTRMPEVKQ